MKKITYLFIILLLTVVSTLAYANVLNSKESFFPSTNGKGKFALVENGKAASLCVSSKDYPGVLRVTGHLQTDIKKVSGSQSVITIDKIPSAREIVIIGTIGKNPMIDKLIAERKIDVTDVAGKWETFVRQVVENPFENVDRALVIAGSDKRGTIYGMYHLSETIGVSPWYWWADVPVKKQSEIYVENGRYSLGEPKVKYRGIFLNDEAPALSGWTREKFGGFNSKFYEHVFELILRLKGNFLWPAMWDNSFATDDTLTPRLADEYGVVVSTSHHEPMMRAWKEWERAGNKKGSWDYSKNSDNLRAFWKEGIRRSNDYEKIVTLAMRGDGDEAMNEDANINLLEQVVQDQRKIISEVTKKDASTVPQVWALYKEVQEYYDKGMRVPDDITILLCDDNWGNLRKLPKLSDPPRKGGYGIYYHFDYVGGPRNYKWLNTNQIERIWEQMHLAYEYGVRQIWIANVGDLKPVEFPINFFLDYAWDPDKISAEKLPEYTCQWAEKQFGEKYSKDIADIINRYTKYNSRRKPELLSPETYSLVDYREAESVVSDYNDLLEKAENISNALPEEYKDAFYQLVLHPVQACANLNDLYITVAKNRLFAKQGRASTNSLAEKVKKLYATDEDITSYYNNVMSDGKWNHMMDQTHIGYTYWQQPENNSMPVVSEINLPDKSEMGVAVEGIENYSIASSKKDETALALPEFDQLNNQKYYIEIFNRGEKSFAYSVQTEEPFVIIDSPNGTIDFEKRIFVSIDWEKAPQGRNTAMISIAGPNDKFIPVKIEINNPAGNQLEQSGCFVENNNYVSMNAENFDKAIDASGIKWQVIPNLGRTGSSVAAYPVTRSIEKPEAKSPHLEYSIFLFNEGEVKVKSYFSPTLNFTNNPQGVCYAISIDDETPQIINMTNNPNYSDLNRDPVWNNWVADNINIQVSKHNIDKPGKHILKFWFVDPGVVLQKIVVDRGGEKPSYLGPPESIRISK